MASGRGLRAIKNPLRCHSRLGAGIGFGLLALLLGPLQLRLDALPLGGGESAEPTTDLASLLTTLSERSAAPVKSVLYQWVDERGSVNFAASLDEVPEAWRQRAGQVELDAGSFAKTRASSLSASPSRRQESMPDSARAHEVTVYTVPWCGWCRKTLAFLDERGVDYVNKDIEADEQYAAELRDKTGGSAIPFVEIDGSQIHGFDPGKMAELLD